MVERAPVLDGTAYAPFDLARYDMSGELSATELQAIKGRSARTDFDHLLLITPRLVAPLLAVADRGGISPLNTTQGVARILAIVDRRGQPYWNWSKPSWLAMLNEERLARPYLTAIAYHLGGLRDFREIEKFRQYSVYAAAIFGRSIVEQQHERLATTLAGLGYSAQNLELHLASVLGSLMLENGDPRLDTFSTDLLQRGQASRNTAVAGAVGKVSAGLAALGIIEQPLRMRNYVGWKDKSVDGVPPEWAAWCRRWRDTSTLRPSTRETNYGFILRIGLWLARDQPQVASPEDWDTSVCAAFIAALDRSTVGEWLLESAPRRNAITHGKPIAANSKRVFLHAMRRFFIDLELWGWAKLRFSPRYHLATPSAVSFNAGVNPRVIDDAAWLKLIWASLNLEREDLLSEIHYPLALVQAMAVIWTHCGLRQNEIARLELGCVRAQLEDIIADDGSKVEAGTLCYLDVPPSKTFKAYVKPVAMVVKERIDAWIAERPSEQAPLIDQRTGQAVRYLFQFRGRRVGTSMLNATIIPILCAKAGVPMADSRGPITSHRGRASAVTALANVPKGMSLIELMQWSGHSSPTSTMHYIRIRPTRLAASFAQADHMAHMVSLLVDHDAISRKGNEPYAFYDLGDSYCTNPFWSGCPHRMACAGCDFNLPKASAHAHALESKASIRRYLEEVPLSADERSIVEGDAAKIEGFISKLNHVATPDGRTPDEIGKGLKNDQF